VSDAAGSASADVPPQRSDDTTRGLVPAEARLPPVVVAIDIGSTKMAVGLMTMQGELIDRDQVPVDHGLNAEALFQSLDEVLTVQIERAGRRHKVRPVVVGVGCAGLARLPVAPTAA
jgi:predicted NBD/HSP70 family sugar kinase